MRNELVYDGVIYGDDTLLSMQADVDTSLNERTLDIDQMQLTLTTRLVDSLPLYEADELPFYTRDDLAFFCAPDNASIDPDFAQNAPLRFLRGGSQKSIWYLQQLTRVGPQEWTLLAFSSLGRLTQMAHRGGIYTGDVPAGDLIREICGYQNGQPAAGVTVYVAEYFEEVALYGWLPYVSPSGQDGAETGSARDNLLQVLFALNATVHADADGVLRVENLSTEVSAILDEDRLYRDGAKVVYGPAVTAITVLEHQYFAGTETMVLFDGATIPGQIIVFREPMTGLSATGFAIVESGSNYAVLSAGSGTLTGIPYIHTTREITRAVTSAPVENIVRIEGATLVGLTNSNDVAARIVDYYAHTARIEADAVIEFEDAGDIISIYDPYDRIMRRACIERIAPLAVSSILKGRVSALLGFTPWQVMPFNDVHEVLTTSGTWRASDHPGVTHLEVYIIGGGDGGTAGSDGEATPGTRTITENYNYTTHNTYYIGTTDDQSVSGEGGAPGTPGAGGKILRVSIPLNGDEIFAYTIGNGGNGAARGTDTPGTGGASIFGAYSSAEGASTPSGWADPTTGTVYAQEGAQGVAGGAGNRYGYTSPNLVCEGITATPGINEALPTGFAINRDWVASSTHGKYRAMWDGSYGGGPAAKSNGAAGNAASTGSFACTERLAYVVTATGGAGADAGKPATPTQRGKGGGGGNGGGGGGAVGRATCGNQVPKDESRGTIECHTTSAAGGHGSDGGDGAPGVIHIYYRVPQD